jgi:hypothetical protein
MTSRAIGVEFVNRAQDVVFDIAVFEGWGGGGIVHERKGALIF